jgi:CheY-like chemotaxis protein
MEGSRNMSQNTYNFMLIDDDPDTQRIFKLVFGQHKHTLHVASNASEAFALLQDEHPDVIVIDLLLPGLDGYQIAERIQQGDLASGAEMVATTAYHSVGTKESVLARGFREFIPKPLDSAGLVPFLVNIAERHN